MIGTTGSHVATSFNVHILKQCDDYAIHLYGLVTVKVAYNYREGGLFEAKSTNSIWEKPISEKIF